MSAVRWTQVLPKNRASSTHPIERFVQGLVITPEVPLTFIVQLQMLDMTEERIVKVLSSMESSYVTITIFDI